MYELWKCRRITKPSEYWNASEGDKIVLKAFYEREMKEKNRERMEMKNNKAPIFPVVIV